MCKFKTSVSKFKTLLCQRQECSANTGPGFCLIELEMATSRDDQSARVTKKKLKDVQYVYSAQTQQKGINRMASPISPPRRGRARFSSISSPCAIVQHPVTACPYVACSGPSHYAHTCSSLQRSSQTQLGLAIAFSRNPMLQHASTSLLGRGVSFRGDVFLF